MLSKRIQKLKVSPNRKYNSLAADAEKRGIKVNRLNVGQPDLEAPDLFFEAIHNYPERKLPYANSQGIRDMIQAQIRYYRERNLHYESDQIFISAGAAEGLIFSLLTVCDPGDGVLLIEPFYTNYELITDLIGIEIHPVTTSIANNYRVPSKEVMEKALKPNTRAILLSNPGNPTGRVYSREEMQTIHDLVVDNDLILIADEVYREFNFSGRDFISFADYPDLDQKLILLDSASKKYAACGARIGSLATKNPELAASILKLCQMRLSAPILEQVGVAALAELDENYFNPVTELYQRRKDVLLSSLKELENIRFSQPEGAFYTLVQLPLDNAEDFVIWLLKEFQYEGETILPTPAESFYSTHGLGRNEVRISYCIDEEILKKSITILAHALEEYPGTWK